MNFSDETVERIANKVGREIPSAYRTTATLAALSSLTLADLMGVDKVRELVRLSLEAANTLEQCVKVEWGWPNVHPANKRRYDRDMEQVQDILKATKAFTEAK